MKWTLHHLKIEKAIILNAMIYEFVHLYPKMNIWTQSCFYPTFLQKILPRVKIPWPVKKTKFDHRKISSVDWERRWFPDVLSVNPRCFIYKFIFCFVSRRQCWQANSAGLITGVIHSFNKANFHLSSLPCLV